MKIKKINLKAFGSFTDLELDFGSSPAFTLVYGLNEAGKSTVLRAVGDFLYGIPHVSPDAHYYPTDKLRIEAILKTGDGGELTLTRRKGTKNTLLDEENNPVPEAVLLQFLGGINRELFTVMFGMDHHRLRRGGEELLQGRGALGEALFEAATGISGLREVITELDNESGELYKPSGSKPLINSGLKIYYELKQKINELALAPRNWEEIEEKYFDEKDMAEKLKDEEKEITKKVSQLERLQNTMPLVARRNSYLEEMAALGVVPELSPAFREERTALQNRRKNAAQAKEQAVNDLERLQNDTDQISISPEILEHEGDITALQERLHTYRSHVKEIPTLEGEINELEAAATALLRSLAPSLSTIEEAEALRLPLTRIKEIRQLAEDYMPLDQACKTAREKVSEIEFSLENLAEEKANITPRGDASDLLNVLNRVRKKGNLEEELGKKNSAAAALEIKLQNKLEALGLWTGTLYEVQHTELPLSETVRSFEDRFRAMDNETQNTADKITEEEKNLQSSLQQLEGGGLSGEVPTEEILHKTREHRQQGWRLIRRAWLEGQRDEAEEENFNADQPLDAAYESSVTKSDEISDRLRYEANRVERKTLLLSAIEQSQETISRLNEQLEGLQQKKESLKEEWKAAWALANIEPLSPPEMQSWLGSCREIIAGLEQLNEHRAAQKELSEAVETHKQEISTALQDLGEPGTEAAETLEMLIDRAQQVCDKYREAVNRLKNIEEACKSRAKELDSARRRIEAAEADLEKWQEKWVAALSEARQPEQTTIAAASAYLEKLEELFRKKDELAGKQTKLQNMKSTVQGFQSRLGELLKVMAPDLSSQPADQAAAQLQARAVKTRRDKDRLDSLEEQIKKAKESAQKADEEIEATDRALKELIREACCKDESELPEMEEKAHRLQKLRENLENVEEQLLSLGGGLQLEEIIAETDGVDGDELPGEINALKKELEEIGETKEEVNRNFGATRKEYEEKVKGASEEAANAAENAQGMLAQLKGQTEDYLRLRLASIVLRRGIDRYREENQSPVITKSGEYFSRLTKGSFANLKVDFDEKDNPVLLGLRPGGEEVKVEGMSDGSLDQLYLALRLASIERHLEQNEPLPIILDDLLINFDDQRSADALTVLGEFAAKTQIIFFTHHLNIVEQAARSISAGQKITL